jgi:hypothetical protein
MATWLPSGCRQASKQTAIRRVSDGAGAWLRCLPIGRCAAARRIVRLTQQCPLCRTSQSGAGREQDGWKNRSEGTGRCRPSLHCKEINDGTTERDWCVGGDASSGGCQRVGLSECAKARGDTSTSSQPYDLLSCRPTVACLSRLPSHRTNRSPSSSDGWLGFQLTPGRRDDMSDPARRGHCNLRTLYSATKGKRRKT